MIRVATWNVRSGGEKRRKSILAVLEAIDADVLVLTEYQRTRTGADLVEDVAAAGWPDTYTTVSISKEKSTMVASRIGLESIAEIGHQNAPHRALHTRIPGRDLEVVGAYLHGVLPKTPRAAMRAERDEMYSGLAERLEPLSARNALVIGDFNTGLPIDSTNDYFSGHHYETYLNIGWIDAYRQIHGDRHDFSWYNPNGGNGFRIDHAFLAPPLRERLVDAQLLHEAGGLALHRYPGRPDGQKVASDHAALVLDLDI